jgi:hypothetical protein
MVQLLDLHIEWAKIQISEQLNDAAEKLSGGSFHALPVLDGTTEKVSSRQRI